jgi:beta-barrel assembly-enhancing protease
MKLLLKLLPLLCIFTILIGACENPIEPPIDTSFTLKDENNLGKQIHQAILNTGMLTILKSTDYPSAIQYINSVKVQLLGTNYMERRNIYDWDIHIIHNDNAIDCFTTVGGQIYIYTGLLKSLHSEAQLMGILAHEIFYADQGYQMAIIDKDYALNMLLDVSYGGEDQKALEMLSLIYNEPRNANKAIEADQYGMSLLCLTHTKASEMGVAIEEAYLANNTWYKNHPHPLNSSFENSRKPFFLASALDATCGGTDSGFSRYGTFRDSYLPGN